MSLTSNGLTQSFRGLWREAHGGVPNSLALAYAFGGQLGGFWLLSIPNLFTWILGTLLVAHTLVISAYLVHEAAHMTLFRRKSHNETVGELLLWWVGGAYASYQRVRHMHLRHHQDRADVSCFDYQGFLKRQPDWVRRWVFRLEWAYIPAIELIMHAQVIVRPFIESRLAQYRPRVIIVGATRLLFFMVLLSISPWVLLGYAIAYLIMIQALHLADAFAHTYEAYFVEAADEPVPQEGRDREYDVDHTYSNLISTRHPWLNLLNLNFGYHTAHHEKASTAWHDLPTLHHELYGDTQHRQVLPYRQLWRTLHNNRLKRIFESDYGDVGEGENRGDSFVGAHGVSFLTIV